MTLTIKKHDKEELQAYIDAELACYAIRLDGIDIDTSAQPDSRGNFPRKHLLGAIEQIVERNLFFAMNTLQERIDQGYKIFISQACSPEISPTGAGILYVTKPEAPALVNKIDEDGSVVLDDNSNPVQVENRINGAVYQCDDKAKIIAEVTAKYEADIDAHNNKVFEQEAAALRAEEDEARKQLLREEASKANADFERRVQQRLRGMRVTK
ncbi:hypothetical protein [Pseudomonas sp. NFACC07-1]|uniref:hypothetical protein n=1 Tax=Pseudomonas sp. NFACC07-1 TaxID=1566239 RepID=UPI0008D105A3|nr:hypothetical protein [Pseudomonas sp. NFACC07-1]SEI69588.1 hypothetical protein SAMN03159298_01088 [Pseudomonas sp. NFACC07-1]